MADAMPSLCSVSCTTQDSLPTGPASERSKRDRPASRGRSRAEEVNLTGGKGSFFSQHPLIPYPDGQLFTVEVLQERDHELSGKAGQIPELGGSDLPALFQV